MGSNKRAHQSLHRNDSSNSRRTSDADKAIIKVKQKRAKAGAQLIFGITALIFSTTFTGLKDMKELHQRTRPLVVAIFLIVTFITTVILMKLSVTMNNTIWQHKAVTLLTLIAGILFMVTHNLLMVLASRSYGFLFFLEFPEVIMLVVLVYAGMPKDHDHYIIHDDNYENTIQSASDDAVFATAVAFSMHMAILWGYIKNPLFQEHHHPQTDLSLTFLAVIFTLSCLMITSMPLIFHSPRRRDVFVGFVKGLQKAMLATLAASAVVLGEKFFDGFVLLAFIPELTIVFVNQGVEFFQRETNVNQDSSNEEEELSGMFVLTATVNLTLLATLHGMYNGNIDGNYKFYIKAAILFLVSSTLSSLRCIAIRFKPPNYGVSAAAIVEIVIGLIYPLLEILVVCPLILKIAIDLYKSL